MRSVTLLPASLLAAALALPCASAAFANIDIAIDKNTQQMSVAVDGAQRYTWPVSTGRPGYDTPNGTFKVNRMDASHFSQEWDNAPMPHTMFFDMRGHAIHGFSDVAHLGLAVSHGCVRLAPANATVLFNLVKAEGMANTSVTITGRTPNGDTGPVARERLPDNETVYSPQHRWYDRSRRRVMASNRRPVTASNSSQVTARRHRPVTASSSSLVTASSSRTTASSCRPSRRLSVTASSRITGSAFTARVITPSPLMGSSRSRTTASSRITDSRSPTTGARSRRIEQAGHRRRLPAVKNGIGFGLRC